MRPSCLVVRGALLVAAAASVGAPLPAGAQAESPAPFVPVTDAMLESPAAGDWLTWRRTPDGWGYSPLDQIDTDNVGELRLVWTRALAAGSQQGTPLAYGGVLYMPNPNDVIQAIDAVTGDLRWEYRRELPDDINDYVNGASTNRNIAIYGTRIIDTGADNYLYALDARTGRLAWETQILDYLVNPARHSSGSHCRRRQGDLGPELPTARRAGGLRHHRPRRGDRGRGLAAAPGAGPGRAGRRNLGRGALRGAGSRRVVDGAQLRPRAEPGLRRDVGHVAGAQSSSSVGSRTATSTTTRRWPSTATPARSCGTTST